MSWIITGTEKLPSDPDAAAYIANVEAADGQELEYDVRMAYNAFVKGCKADGIWDAIKASCILAGARTLDGALVPLAGTAPTNYNFVAGDYNRKTGLVGNESTKYLNSNRNNNADPQNNKHVSLYVSDPGPSGSKVYIDAGGGAVGATNLYVGTLNVYGARNNSSFANTASISGPPLFFGCSRDTAANFVIRRQGASSTVAVTSQTPYSGNYLLYPSSAPRLAFYSIGESLDLALLDARITTLINAFSTAIP